MNKIEILNAKYVLDNLSQNSKQRKIYANSFYNLFVENIFDLYSFQIANLLTPV